MPLLTYYKLCLYNYAFILSLKTLSVGQMETHRPTSANMQEVTRIQNRTICNRKLRSHFTVLYWVRLSELAENATKQTHNRLPPSYTNHLPYSFVNFFLLQYNTFHLQVCFMISRLSFLISGMMRSDY